MKKSPRNPYKTSSYLSQLDRFAPDICRRLARHGHKQKAMSNEELAIASGLSVAKVIKLSTATTWANETVKVMDAFTKACGVTPRTERRQRAYIKATFKGPLPLPHLWTLKPKMRKALTKTQ